MNWNILLHEKVKKLSKTTCALSKGLSSQVKGLPSSQIWNDLSIKKNNYTGLMYIVHQMYYKIPELNIQWSPLEDVEDPTHSENWPRKGGITFILSFLIGYLRVLKSLMRKSSFFYKRISSSSHRRNIRVGTSTFCIS